MHSQRTNDARSAQLNLINDAYIVAFEHLARGSAPALTAEFPPMTDDLLIGLLVSVGMSAALTIEKHMRRFSHPQHELIIRHLSETDVSLIVEDGDGRHSGIAMWSVWEGIMFDHHNTSKLNPVIRELIVQHVNGRHGQSDEATLISFYALLQDTLRAPPFSDTLTRVAHLPILLLDVIADDPDADRSLLEDEAQRRLVQLYGEEEQTVICVTNQRSRVMN